MPHRLVCGADGCKGGWIVVLHDLRANALTWRVVARLSDLIIAVDEPTLIAVDIPIELPEHGTRACDTEARTLLGERRSSVFPAPIRAMLHAHSHEEACAIGREAEARALSVQSWGIIDKIREVDIASRGSAVMRSRLVEVHPELSFRALNGGAPLAHSKKDAEGRAEREKLLRAAYGKVVDEAQKSRPPGCQSDDLLDAFAAAWTAARIAREEAVTIPAEPERDETGLRMRMVY